MRQDDGMIEVDLDDPVRTVKLLRLQLADDELEAFTAALRRELDALLEDE